MKSRKSEMQTRFDYEMRYIDHCNKNGTKVDWDRVKTGFINAFGAGIIHGDCGNDCVFELKDMKIDDKHFQILLDALTTKNNGSKSKPENITLKFPVNNLTNDSLQALAHALLNKNFPQNVTIDLSQSTGFNDAGVKKLIESLSDKKCNLSVNIKLPENPRMVQAELMHEFNVKMKANQKHYRPASPKPKRKAAKSTLFKSKADEKKLVKKEKITKTPKTAKTAGKSLFTPKYQELEEDTKGNKRSIRHRNNE